MPTPAIMSPVDEALSDSGEGEGEGVEGLGAGAGAGVGAGVGAGPQLPEILSSCVFTCVSLDSYGYKRCDQRNAKRTKTY